MDELKLDYYSADIAWALLNGFELQLSELPIIPHNRGCIVVGVFLTPFFVLLGPTLVAMKVAAISISTATAFLFIRLLEQHAGVFAAWSGALLFALLPPSYQMVDVLLLGSHGEVTFVTLTALIILLTLKGCASPSLTAVFALGLACGLGLFFSLQFLVVIPALLLLWSSFDSRFFLRRTMLLFLAGIAIGLAPIAFFVSSASEANSLFEIPLQSYLLSIEVDEVLFRIREFVTVRASRSWMFDSWGGKEARWLYSATIVLSVVLTLPSLRTRKPLSIFFAGYAFLWIAAYSLVNTQIAIDDVLDGMGSRYSMPFSVCLIALTSLSAGRLAERSSLLAGALVLPALIAGIAGISALADPLCAFRQPSARATAFSKFKTNLDHLNYAERLEWIQKLEPDWAESRPFLYEFRRPNTLKNRELARAIQRDLELARSQLPELQPYIFASLGRQLTPPLLRTVRASHTTELPAWVLRGFGAALIASWWSQGTEADGILRELPPDAGRYVAQGMGFWLGNRLSPYSHQLLKIHKRFLRFPAPQLEEAYFRALGWGYRTRYIEEGYSPPIRLKIESRMSVEQHKSFRSGLADPPWHPEDVELVQENAASR